MNRRLWIPLAGILISAAAFACGRTGIEENGFTLSQFHNADTKFLGNQIITSVDEGILTLNLEGQITAYFPELKASWIYVQEDAADSEQVVAYSNHDNETHILRLTDDGEMVADQIAVRTDTLAIDPILIRTDDGWLLTHTMIDGTINNPDPEGENGVYTVKLYRSADLDEWEYVTDIISRKQNLEDGDIRVVDGVLYYFFEMEEYDKGPSKICVMTSADGGENWSEPKELITEESDNEMASWEWNGQSWRVYFSSDLENLGTSYQGAKAYFADFSDDFETGSEWKLLPIPDNEAVRLYDVKEIDGQFYALYARNFLTDCDLLMRTFEIEERNY